MPILQMPDTILPHAKAFKEILSESELSEDHPIVMLCMALQMQIAQLSHHVFIHEMKIFEMYDGAKTSSDFGGQSVLTTPDEKSLVFVGDPEMDGIMLLGEETQELPADAPQTKGDA